MDHERRDQFQHVRVRDREARGGALNSYPRLMGTHNREPNITSRVRSTRAYRHV